MYKNFYRLRIDPFEITPDPAFLFPTTRHNEALASLYYGVTAHKGFVVLSGEVGTGKTLLLRSLLGLLQQRNVAFSLVFNPALSPLEFLRYIVGDFGLRGAGLAKDELLQVLNSFLLSRHRQKLTTLLVIDEAHHLNRELLEEIRLLSNLETAKEKLLQIVLAGQPELDQKLDSFDLRQLKQRIALRCHLDALSLEETRKYVERRLKIAGRALGVPDIFPNPTISAVFRHSRGIPRLINTICENALVAGYVRRSEMISPEMIEDVARDLRLGVVLATPQIDGDGLGQEQLFLAIKTLLELHHRLQGGEAKTVGSIANGITKHEPYI